MLSDYFTTNDQAVIFALIAFLLFFIFFIIIAVHTISMKKTEVEKMKMIPFENESVNPGDR